MAISNIMEEIVKQKLDEMLEDYEGCKCEKCYADMLAIALNMVKPKYVSTKKGGLMVKIDETKPQNLVDISSAVYRAIQIVKENPRHKLQ